MERDLNIATGQVQYHLRRLVNDEVLVVDRINSRVEQTHTASICGNDTPSCSSGAKPPAGS